MTNAVRKWHSTLRTPDATWQQAESTFTITNGTVFQLNAGDDLPVSPYKRKFRQGAILVPRVLVTVEDAPASALGAGAGRRRVRSRRTNQEKEPWKYVSTLTGSVETEHVRRTYLGESIAPYRPLEPILSVLPLENDRLMRPSEIAENPGLSDWWTQAEAAERLGIGQSRVSDLVRGKRDKFSLDMLVTLATRAGQHVELALS